MHTMESDIAAKYLIIAQITLLVTIIAGDNYC
jgi:hypothetical protein